MKAIRLHQPGGPDQLRYEEVPTPRPGPGEVLVQLKAAALNHRDVWIRMGMQMADRLPLIPGSDGAGLVTEVGPGTSHLWGKALRALRPGGRLISFGATTGRTTELDIRHIFWNQISILGTTMGSPREFAAMLALYEAGRLKPVVDSVFPLRETPAAHRRMDEAQQFGKIVLVP